MNPPAEPLWTRFESGRRLTMLARRAFAPYCGPLCRAGLSTSETSWARHVPKQTGVKQTDQPGTQPGDSVAVTNSSPNSVGSTPEQWAEVVDQTSGQKYYWNQQTSKYGPSDFPRLCLGLYGCLVSLRVQNRQSLIHNSENCFDLFQHNPSSETS